MNNFAAVLDGARTERDGLASRIQALNELIIAMESYQRTYTPAVSVTPPLMAPPRAVPDSAVRPAVPNVGADRMAAIEAALKKHGPLPTRGIVKIVGGSKFNVKTTLQRMKAAGRLVSQGATAGQRWSLPGQTAPKTLAEVVTVPRATSPQIGTGPTCKRCDCAFSAHDPTSGKCYGKAGRCVCQAFYK